MNRIYKVIWSKVKNCYIVVSEIAKSHSKPVSKGSRQCVSAAAVLAVLALLSVPAGVYAQDGVTTFVDPANKNIKMGNGISLRNNNGQNGTVAIGDHVQVDDYVMQQGSVAIGTNAFVENMWGGQERTFRFGMTENKDLMAGIAIGQNTYARSGIQIGDHKYIGRLGDTTVDPTTDSGKRNLAIVMGTTTLGHNSYSNGAFTTNTGAFSIMTNGYESGNAMMVGQNFGAVIDGSFNSIESKTSSSMYSGIANAVVGTVNRTNNSNGTLIFGAGNEVTNSVEDIKVPLLGYTPSDAKDLADTLRSNIRGTDGNGTPGGAVLAIGGGNKADYAIRSQLSGVGNTLTGTSSSRASYNMLNGYRNKGTTTSYATMIGTLNTVTNGTNNIIVGNKQKLTSASNNIVLGTADSEIETTVSDAVAIGHNSKTTATGGVALGTGSVASTALGQQGYDPSTKANSTSSAIAWKSTAGAVSVGDASKSVTRQITGVAAGTADTDAVNVAQLRAVTGGGSGGSSVHFFSVNGDETQGNYNNDGATGDNAVAIGTGASATQNGGIAIGHISQATGGTSIALGFNANAGGSSTVIGESSIVNAPNVGQGIGTVIIGSESADIAGDKEAGASSDVILGSSNRVKESNGVFVRGQGNIVDNSYKQETLTTEDQQNLAAQMFMGTPAGDVYEKLGSHVSVNGDGNYVKNAAFSQISGTNNQIVGSDTTSADYNIVSGNRNVVENATNNIVTGDNHTVTGANNNVILGSADTTKEVTVSDTVSIGHNANATVAGGVALGSNSVASVASGVAGYDPTTKTASTATTSTWKSTLGAVSVGVPGDNAAATQTRQITGVAAGMQATDAVNVAQLTAVNTKVDKNTTSITNLETTVNANKTKYYSVDDYEGRLASLGNADNSGAQGIASLVAGIGSKVEEKAGFQGATATVVGALNTVAAGTQMFDGVANSIVGVANATQNANATLIFGAGNAVTNSYADVALNPSDINPADPVGTARKLGAAVGESGGQVLVIGGANSVDYARFSAVTGVSNTLNGASGNTSDYNFITGAKNTLTNTDATYVIGSNNDVSDGSSTVVIGDNRTVTGSDNSIILGRANKETTTTFRAAADTTLTTTADNVVVMGYNANATVDDGVALGSNSVANVYKGQLGYNPSSEALTDTEKASATWTSTLGSVAVGTSVDGAVATATRQITGVAAGTQDTDAVNVAQLKANKVTLKQGDNVTITSDVADDGATTYTIKSTDTDTTIASGTVTYDGADGTLVLKDSAGKPITITGLKDTYLTSATLENNTLTLNRNEGDPIKVEGIATTSQLAANKTHFYSVNSTDEKAGNYNNNGATGTNALAAGVAASAQTNNSVAVGTNARVLGNGGNRDTGTGSIAIGENAVVTTNGINLTSIAMGKGATVLNGSGKQDKALSFTPDNYASGSDLPINADVSPGGIAIGTNAYARTASVQIGNHTMKGYTMGGSEINDQSQANLVGMTTIGSNSYNKGALGSMLGAYSVMTGDFTGAGGFNSLLYGSQNFGANVVGSLNSIRSAGYSGSSGIANSIVGVGNIAENANGALIYGAGNKITNSVQTISGIDTLTSTLTVDEMADALRKGIQSSGGGGSTLAVGGGNTADYTQNTAIIGVNNTVTGARGNVSQYNFVSGYKNTSTGGGNTTIIGTNRTLTGVDNTIVVGSADSTIETTANDAVAIGRNTNVTYDGGVALGANSVARIDKGVVGYDPSGRITDADSIPYDTERYASIQAQITETQSSISELSSKLADTQGAIDFYKAFYPDTYQDDPQYLEIVAQYDDQQAALTAAQTALSEQQTALGDVLKAKATWQATAAAVSVGDASKGITRQITDVAAGTADTDAVNVAQLKANKVTVAAGDNVTVTPTTADDGSTTYTVASTDTNTVLESGKIAYNDKGTDGTITLTDSANNKVTVEGVKNTYLTEASLSGNTLTLTQNEGDPLTVTGLATTSQVEANKIHYFQVNSAANGTNYNNNGATGTDAIAIGKSSTSGANSIAIGQSSTPANNSIAIGKVTISDSNGGKGSGDIAIGNGANINNYVDQGASIAIGQNAKIENMSGTQEYLFAMGQTTFTAGNWLGTIQIPDDPSKQATGIAIGENTYARTGSLMVGSHNYRGAMGDVTVDSANTKAQGVNINSTTLGTNSYNGGAFATIAGAYSIASSNYNGGASGVLQAAKNFGATIMGSLNSVESATASNSSGIANSIVGTANRTFNSNGSLIFGAGNEITNSITTINAPSSAGDSAKALQTTLMNSIKSSNSGGSTLAIGGGNKADYTQQSALIGVNNTLTGTSGNISQYNYITGFKNTGTNVDNVTIIGTNRTVSNAANSVVIGSADSVMTSSASDAVTIGRNANTTIDGGVALGSGSVASVDKEVAGYDVVTKEASTETSATWKSTAAAVSVGDTANNITRQITGVAAGMQDTDAVNVAQLKQVADAATEAGKTTLKFTGDDATAEISRGNNDVLNITGGAAGTNLTDDNIGVVKDGDNALKVKLSKDLTGLNSVAVGDAVTLGTSGLTITNGPSVTTTGINAGSKVITNVAIGVNPTDAVNVSQLTANKVTVAAGTNVTVTPDKANDGSTTYTVAAKDTYTESGTYDATSKKIKFVQNDTDKNYEVDLSNIVDSITNVSGKHTAVTLNGAAPTAGADGALGEYIGTGTLTMAVKDVDGQKVYDLKMSNNLVAGTPGADGKNGEAGSVTIIGEPGSAGADGKNASANITVKDGTNGLDGVDGLTRIIYKDEDGNSHEVATLDDGLNFTGDTAGVTIAKKLNETLSITGGITDADQLTTEDNIGVVASDSGLKVRLAKDLNGLNSVRVGGSKAGEGIYIANQTVTYTKDGADGDTEKGNYITGLENTKWDPTNKGYVSGRAATEDQLNSVYEAINTSIEANKVKGSDNITVSDDNVVSLNNDITLGNKNGTNVAISGTNGTITAGDGGSNKVAIDGTNSTITAGTGDNKVTVDGNNGLVTVGDTTKGAISIGNQTVTPKVVGADGTETDGTAKTGKYITGLDNTTWDPTGEGYVADRAATEGQLKDIADQISNIDTAVKSTSRVFESDSGADAQVTRKSTDPMKLKGGADANNLSDGNIGVVNNSDNTGFDIKLSKDIKGLNSIEVNNKITIGTGDNQTIIEGDTINTGSVTTGNTTINNDGLTIVNEDSSKNITINNNNVNMGGNVIKNIGEGTEPTDAINKTQFDRAINNIGTGMNQINNRVNKLDNRVNRVGAGAAALAALHPLEFSPDAKWEVTAGVGNYRGANAIALGAFYRPNFDTMFSIGTSYGGGENMINAGVTWRIGEGETKAYPSKTVMAQEIDELKTVVSEQQDQIEELKKLVNTLINK